MPYIDMANIACGFHAGNRETIKTTIQLAKQHKVLIGAHPSYPDRKNFGRIPMTFSQADIRDLVFQQITLMEALCEEQGTTLSYIKPHGALYHDLLIHQQVRDGIFQAVSDLDTKVPVLVLAHVNQDDVAARATKYVITLRYEAFADRRYHQNASLQSRTEKGAVITNKQIIIGQAVANSTDKPLTTVEGGPITLKAHSLCVHGDNPEAVSTVKALKKAL